MKDHSTVAGVVMQAPFSSGDSAPETPLPVGATDCHHHIFDRTRHPHRPHHATEEDYRRFKQRLGISRNVVIAPSSYGDDNTVLMRALADFGADVARGVAIVLPEVADAELDRLHQGGVRGLRYYFGKTRVPTADELARMATRIRDRGWHMQFVGDRDAELIPDWEQVLSTLSCPVVVDHFGYPPLSQGVDSRTGVSLRRLLDRGHAYVKLSGVYIQSAEGFPHYSDVDDFARMLVAHNPDRMLWGTDWPHTGAETDKPDGAGLVDQLARWALDAAIRRTILVDNPTRLYWAA